MQTGKIKSGGAGHQHKFGTIEAASGQVRFDADQLLDGSMEDLRYGQKVVFETEGGRAVRVRSAT